MLSNICACEHSDTVHAGAVGKFACRICACGGFEASDTFNAMACAECWHSRGKHANTGMRCICGCPAFVEDLRLPPENVIDFEQRRCNAAAVGAEPIGDRFAPVVCPCGNPCWCARFGSDVCHVHGFCQNGEAYGRVNAGYKASMDDDTKLRHSLVPGSFYDAVARAMSYGAKKYTDENWRGGMPWDVPYSALLRHVFAWWGGQSQDPETGFSHLDHAAAMLAFLVEYEANPAYAANDTRYKGEA